MPGLLVLATLLIAGNPAAHAFRVSVDNATPHEFVGAASQANQPPCTDHDGDHGLPCCVGAKCAASQPWLQADPINITARSLLGAPRWVSGEARQQAEFDAAPIPPPPRTIV